MQQGPAAVKLTLNAGLLPMADAALGRLASSLIGKRDLRGEAALRKEVSQLDVAVIRYILGVRAQFLLVRLNQLGMILTCNISA
jgi:hypothetical protein